jgi:ParB-like chromosome segregation protein Spo0J
MVTSLSREQLSDLARPVVDLVEKFGFQWEFDFEHPTPDRERRVQIRDPKHYAPPQMVSLLRAAMKRGEKFPPIVVTQDDFLVDGNARTEAAQKNGYPTIQAIVIDAKYEGAKESERRRMHALGAAFNARHGKGIDRKEIADAVETIGADPSYTATRIAALIGVTEATVQGFLAEKKGRDRATNLGFHVNGSVSAAKLRTLGRQSEYLNDGPFKELFALVDSTGMSEPEIKDVAKRMREAKSDEGAVEIVQAERETRKDQIAEFKASGKSKPPASAKLRQRLGFILAFAENPRELVEHNPNLAKEHADAIERAIIVLQSIAKGQGA